MKLAHRWIDRREIYFNHKEKKIKMKMVENFMMLVFGSKFKKASLNETNSGTA